MNNCKWCNDKLIKSTSKIFCNRDCCKKYRYMNIFLDWYLFSKDVKDNKTLKGYIEAIHGKKCSLCNIKTWNNEKIVFEVEHIDGNSLNNNPNNVCLLCPNCHSQTPTYKVKNKGFGRFSSKHKSV